MDPRTVYAKTEQGQHEVATRAHHLPARVRAMLIMVDGKHSVEQLLTGHPAPEDALEQLRQLAEGGFIAATGPAPAAAPAVDVPEVRRLMVGLLIDLLGPEADAFAMRIEGIKGRDELLREAEKLHAMLETSLGREPAARFRDKVFPLLG